MKPAAFLGALALLVAGCGSAPAPGPAPVQSSGTPAAPIGNPGEPDAGAAALAGDPPAAELPARPAEAAPKESDTEPSEEESLLALVRDNIAVTELSALVRITAARVEGPNGAPPPTTGYVNHVYAVDVVAPLAGCGELARFEFAQMAEADLRPMPVGAELFVSLCRETGGGRWFTPDVGYAIPRSELPKDALATLKKTPRAKRASACRD